MSGNDDLWTQCYRVQKNKQGAFMCCAVVFRIFECRRNAFGNAVAQRFAQSPQADALCYATRTRLEFNTIYEGFLLIKRIFLYGFVNKSANKFKLQTFLLVAKLTPTLTNKQPNNEKQNINILYRKEISNCSYFID